MRVICFSHWYQESMFGVSKLYNIFFYGVTTAMSKTYLSTCHDMSRHVTTIFDGKECLPELAGEPMTCVFSDYSPTVRPRHRRSFDRWFTSPLGGSTRWEYLGLLRISRGLGFGHHATHPFLSSMLNFAKFHTYTFTDGQLNELTAHAVQGIVLASFSASLIGKSLRTTCQKVDSRIQSLDSSILTPVLRWLSRIHKPMFWFHQRAPQKGYKYTQIFSYTYYTPYTLCI